MGYCVSLLLLSKPGTEALLDVSEIGLLISGFVLVFGAIGEYLEEHGRLPRWMKWPKLAFIIMVVLSLVGEFVSDAGVFLFARALQTISDRELAEMKNKLEVSTAALTADFKFMDTMNTLAQAELRL